MNFLYDHGFSFWKRNFCLLYISIFLCLLCLLPAERARLSFINSPPPPTPQPRPLLRSLHNVLETSFLSLIQNSHQEIGIFYMIMDFGKETSTSHVSPWFFACCLLKELSYQLHLNPLTHSIQVQFVGIIFMISAIVINKFIFFMLFVDLNEYTMNTHNCNANNYSNCNNTVGSFTCTCEPGFSGNGISCTGRQWYIMLSTFKH